MASLDLRRALGTVARVAAVGVASLVLAELLLQGAALFAPDRSGAWDPQASRRILAVGDSHTWGTGVDRSEAYPAQLQKQLDASTPGVYSVINMGIPGMNTSQLRRRLPVWLGRYQPHFLITWTGQNNIWNRADVEGGAGLAWLDRNLQRSRLYRFVRVQLHQMALDRAPEGSGADFSFVHREHGGANPTRVFQHDGVRESITHQRRADLEGDVMRDITVRDFGRIAEQTRGAGAELIVISYPTNHYPTHLVNSAIEEASVTHGLRWIDSARSLARIPAPLQRWLPGRHPDAGLYGEVARDVAAAVLQADGRAPQ